MYEQQDEVRGFQQGRLRLEQEDTDRLLHKSMYDWYGVTNSSTERGGSPMS